MAEHTGRLVATIILCLITIIGLMNGYWAGSLFWLAITLAVGYPFIRGGRLNLHYDDPPVKMVVVAPQ